jgi:toxin HigB-1
VPAKTARKQSRAQVEVRDHSLEKGVFAQPGMFLDSGFSCAQAESPLVPPLLTHTIGLPLAKRHLENIIAPRYYRRMIDSFASDETEKIFRGQISMKFPKDIQRTARRKLIYLDDAEDLQDLLAPPGNRLEKLKGNRAGQHSIRINDRWRICFKWSGSKAKDVEIVDYHR